MISKCEACGIITQLDRAHIKTRGSGAGWEYYEYIFLCRRDHIKQGQLGWKKFCELYPHLVNLLKSKGWEFEKVFGIWKLKNVNAVKNQKN